MPVGLHRGQNRLMHGVNALAGDPVSAYGGIIISNVNIDKETASDINKNIFRSYYCPGFR